MEVINKYIVLKSKLIGCEIKFYKIFLACLILSILNGLVFAYIAGNFFPNLPGNPIDKESFWAQFLIICIFAPLVETYLFMVLPNVILNKLRITNIYLQLIIPAILFGANHYYNPLYIIAMFFGGLIMNFLYIYCKHTRNNYQAFFYVALLHMLYNGFALITSKIG